MSAILDAYEADLQRRGARSATADFAGRALRAGLGNLRPEHLTDAVVERYIAARRAAGRKDGTIRRELAGVLRPALALAERRGWIDRTPHIEAPSDSPAEDGWLTHEQYDRLLSECRSPHMRLFVLLGLHTAARHGAILELTWDRVDLDKRRIDFGSGHGRKRRAVVPINDELLPALVAAREVARTDHVIEDRGKPIKSIKAAFKRACVRAGVGWAHAHILRHTAATWMIEAGVPQAEVARFLGDTEEMVVKRYGKHSPEYLNRAASALTRREK